MTSETLLLPVGAAASGVVIAGVVAFIAITVIIGISTTVLVKKSSRRFIVAGKSLPLFFVGTMLTAQAIDGNGTLGNSGLAYDFGFWAGAVFPIALAVCLFLTGAVFARKLNRMNLLTLPDFYYRRYGTAVEGPVGVLMGISFIILVAGNFAATAFILQAVFDIEFATALVLGAAIILAYTAGGGLFSCAYTDIFQIYLAIFGFIAAFAYIALGYAGPSWDELINGVPDSYLDFSGLTDKDNGAILNWGTFFAVALGDIIALDFMERVFAARDGKTAARGAYWAGSLTLLIAFPVAMIGIFAVTLVPEAESSFLVYPQIAIDIVPPWIGILMLAGVLGASMSTANGGILALSAVISRNFIQREVMSKLLKRPPMGNARLLLLTRVFLIPVVILALWFAYEKPQPGTLLALAFDVVLAGSFVPILLGLYWNKSNTPAALAAVIVGTVTRLIGYMFMNEIWFSPSADALSYVGIETMIPPILSLITFVGVALATQEKYPGYVLHGVVEYVPPDDDIVTGDDLKGYVPPLTAPARAK